MEGSRVGGGDSRGSVQAVDAGRDEWEWEWESNAVTVTSYAVMQLVSGRLHWGVSNKTRVKTKRRYGSDPRLDKAQWC